MTAAVCLKCGCIKVGAYTECPDCGFMPKTEEDQNKAIVLSDWTMEWEEMERLSEHLKAGGKIHFTDGE